MATQAQLEEGLRRADAAGNADDARAFAKALASMRKGLAGGPVGGQGMLGEAAGRVGGKLAPDVFGSGSAKVSDSRSTAERIAGPLVSAVQVPLFDMADEISGGIAGAGAYVLNGFDSDAAGAAYDKQRDFVRRAGSGFAEANPVLDLGIKLGTGVAAATAALPRALWGTAASLGTRAAGAGITGAGLGALSGFGAGEGGLEQRVGSAATGGVVGGVLGPAAEAAATGFARLWRSAFQRPQGPPRMVDPNGQPTQEAIDMANQAGIDLNSLTPEALERMDAAAARGAVAGTPGTDAAMVSAALPVEIPLSVGQSTNDLEQLMLERALLRGGGPGSGIMRDLRDTQQGAIEANIPALQERMGGTLYDRGQGAAMAQGRLVEMAEAEKARASAAYAEARRLEREAAESGSGIPFAPLDESADDLNRMTPGAEGEFDRAVHDVNLARGRGQTRDKAIIRTIQELGGIRLTNPDGTRANLAGDIEGIFDKKYPPGLVNNKNGKSLDYIRESLGEMGWFGNKDPQSVSAEDVVELIRDRVSHPDSVRGDWRLSREQGEAQSDLRALGVTGRTRTNEAAARLAGERAPAPVDNLEDLRAGFDAVDDAPFIDDSFAPATGFQGDLAGQLLGRLYSDLRNDGHYLRTLPGVRAEMNDLTREISENGALPIGRAFESLKRFTAVQSNGGQDAVAAGVAKRRIESEIDAALDAGLLEGDRAVIDAFRNARATYREYAGRFKRDDLVGRLVERNPRRPGEPGAGFELKHDPAEAVNYIFGGTDLGLIKKKDVGRDLARIRDLLGADSAEWNGLRQEAWAKIANRATTGSTPTGRLMSGANIAKGWEDFVRDNRTLAETLFTPQERRDIGNFVNTARRVTTADSAAYAPSTSSYEQARNMDRLVRSLVARVPWIGKWAGAMLEGVTQRAQAIDATSQRLPAVPAAPRRGSPEVPGVLLGGTSAYNGPGSQSRQ